MKRLKAGPELKMPDLGSLRVPAFLEDLYYDLKDRRLLPLVALAIVAIIAVPFLLSGGSDKPEPSAAAPVGGATASAAGAEASLTVVRANPGLRDYRKRLRDRTPTDPFKQRFTQPELSGSQLGSPGDNGFEAPSPASTTTSTSTSTSIESTATNETTTTTRNENGVVTTETETNGAPNSGGGGGGGGAGSNGAEPERTFYSFAIDVRIKTAVTAPDGSVEAGEPVTASQLLSPAAIPTEKTPVVAYIGVSGKTGNAIMLVSDEVTSIFGEAKCVVGSQRCQLLELEVGMPATFVYGPAGERYKITVVKIERIHTELPERLEHTAVAGRVSP